MANDIKIFTDDNSNNDIPKKQEVLGYIDGYTYKEKINYVNGKKDRWVKVEDPTKRIISSPKKNDMFTDEQDNFLYSKSETDFMYEDPTYLGFSMYILLDDSPLFNYGDKIETIHNNNSAINFINKYSTISAIAKRKPVYNEFVNNILKIFSTNDSNHKGPKQYYISSISGLDKLNTKMVEYEKDIISVTLTEDVSMRVQYLAELYNNLVYSYKDGKQMIPENCLRFGLMIKIADMRNYKIGGEYKITNVPYIVYKLYDCNFDFTESKNTKDAITIAGFAGLEQTPADLTLKIKYKSVERVFKSSLIKDSHRMENKKNVFYKSGQEYADNNIPEYEKQKFPDNKEYEKIKTPLGDVFSQDNAGVLSDNIGDSKLISELSKEHGKLTKNDIINGLTPDGNIRRGSDPKKSAFKEFLQSTELDFVVNNDPKNYLKGIKDGTIDIAKNYKKEIIDDLENSARQTINRGVMELRNARGYMINKLTSDIRGSLKIPNIYPDNVYAPDFYDFTLENVAKGLATDLFNDTEKSLKDILNQGF
ncbi:hypothetical protein M0Q50_06850 [bacterium]|jgi:hypothetical protein|nr:hypothetical protein [bacterium]